MSKPWPSYALHILDAIAKLRRILDRDAHALIRAQMHRARDRRWQAHTEIVAPMFDIQHNVRHDTLRFASLYEG